MPTLSGTESAAPDDQRLRDAERGRAQRRLSLRGTTSSVDGQPAWAGPSKSKTPSETLHWSGSPGDAGGLARQRPRSLRSRALLVDQRDGRALREGVAGRVLEADFHADVDLVRPGAQEPDPRPCQAECDDELPSLRRLAVASRQRRATARPLDSDSSAARGGKRDAAALACEYAVDPRVWQAWRSAPVSAAKAAVRVTPAGSGLGPVPSITFPAVSPAIHSDEVGQASEVR